MALHFAESTQKAFVCHTPFQFFLATSLAMERSRYADCVVFYEDPRWRAEREVTHAPFGRVVRLPGYSGYLDSRRLVIANVEAIHQTIHEVLGSGRLHWFFSDLRWPTNNRLYFSLERPRSEQVSLFVDGLGSYLERRDHLRMTGYSIVKSILGLVGFGPRYRAFGGQPFGQDATKVSEVIGPRPELIVGEVMKSEFVFSDRESAGNHADGGLLFLGAPLDQRRCGTEEATSLSLRAIALAERVSARRRYYKPHHFEPRSLRDPFLQAGYQLVDFDGPAEELIVEAGMRSVVSFYSTGLAFAPIISDGRTQSYSVCFDEVATMFMNRRDREALREVLHAFGVQFL